MLYRVKANGKGIYNAIKELLGGEEWHRFQSSDAANWLPNPGEELYDKYDCYTVFTEEGYRRFLETVVPLFRFVLPIEIWAIPDRSGALYSDKYQKVFLKE